MSLSVTCQCGAKLELDDAFVGKDVPCPDCSRPLATKLPVPQPVPPPLDLPDYRRTSALAVYSFTTSLVLGFAGFGIIGIALGMYALRAIGQRPRKLSGVKLAKAGIIIGSVLTLLSVVQYFLPTVAGLDRLLREFKFVDRLQYTNSDVYKVASQQRDLSVARPSPAWARLKTPGKLPENVWADDIILINVARNAFVSYQNVQFTDDDLKSRLAKVAERFSKSELVNLLGQLDGTPMPVEMPELKGKNDELLHLYEATFELRLAGKTRRFLLQFPTGKDADVIVKIAAAPRNQFDRLEEDFRKAFRKPD